MADNRDIRGILDAISRISEPTPDDVWEKALYINFTHEILGYRRDAQGNLIQRSAYGDRSSPFGWEMDHIVPLARGGRKTLANTRPLHWRANVAKSDSLSGLLDWNRALLGGKIKQS